MDRGNEERRTKNDERQQKIPEKEIHFCFLSDAFESNVVRKKQKHNKNWTNS